MGRTEHPFGFGIGPEGADAHPDLAQLLRQWQAPELSSEARAALRADFLGSKPASDTSGAPNTLGKALLAWEAPDPPAALRAQWKAGFVEPEAQPQVPDAREARRRNLRPARSRSNARPKSLAEARRSPWKLWGPVLAAAGLVLLYWGFRANQGQSPAQALAQWTVIDPAPGLRVDGKPWGGDARELAQAQVLTAPPDQSVRLAYGRLFQVALGPASQLEVGGMPAQDVPGPLQLAMLGDEGGCSIQTGPDFHALGRGMAFRTPEVEVRVTGTVFAVDRYLPSGGYPGGTCVCCAEGVVEVKHHAGEVLRTPAGDSVFVFEGPTPVHPQEIPGPHRICMDALIEADPPTAWRP
ncbi:MAG: hypothetical protein H6830_11755 [Planctomycetes bacterium]|nr:hypothetical protein [Planctomycetota bacterium]MCB9908851.1 hypothetical protein [Planctomycetota bacterium]